MLYPRDYNWIRARVLVARERNNTVRYVPRNAYINVVDWYGESFTRLVRAKFAGYPKIYRFRRSKIVYISIKDICLAWIAKYGILWFILFLLMVLLKLIH